MNATLIDTFPTLRLELESRPECVTLVRSMIAGLGEFLELDLELLDDLRTAISEACNNVVLHAYDGRPGPLIVSLEITRDGFEVVVLDRGGGIQRVASGGVIEPPATTAPLPAPAPELNGDVVVTLSPVGLLGEVLGRLTRAVAAGAHFSMDRFSDLYPITDALAAFAERSAAGPTITFAIVGRPRQIQLTVGPLAAGTARALPSDGGSPLSCLVDELAAEPAGTAELLAATIVDRRESD